MRAAVLVGAIALGACSQVYEFYCDEDSQCVVEDDDGVVYQGTCVAGYDLCAFPETECMTSMLIYDDSAGELAGVCVGDEPFPPD